MSFNDLLNKINQNKRLQEGFNPGNLVPVATAMDNAGLDSSDPEFQKFKQNVENLADAMPGYGHEIAKQAGRFVKDYVKNPAVDAFDNLTRNDTTYNNAIKTVKRWGEQNIVRPTEDAWDKLSPMQQAAIKYGTPAALAGGLGAYAIAKRMRNVNKNKN